MATEVAHGADPLDRWVTAAEAAHFLGFAVSSLAGWRLRGGGPIFVRKNRAVRYFLRDADTWMRHREGGASCPRESD